MEQLRIVHESIELYNAGFPHFPRNFSRDSIISGILMEDWAALRNQLVFSAMRQGRKTDPATGEEIGKIFHEYPGFTINDRSTEFNACDTTALFLIGHQHYAEGTGDPSLKDAQQENLLNAVQYIKSHLIGEMFYENPSLSGADRFALKVTYWKDSEIARRENGTPAYPVAYFLAHAINLAGIRSASRLLPAGDLQQLADRMRERIHDFFDRERRAFRIAIDAQGPIEGISSDVLHALFYLEPGDLTQEELAAIQDAALELETPIGYLTLSPKSRDGLQDQYHAATVWPFEQAIISRGARKFGLEGVFDVSNKIADRLDTAPEIFIVRGEEITKGGCDPQLWTIAAKKYFSMRLLQKTV